MRPTPPSTSAGVLRRCGWSARRKEGNKGGLPMQILQANPRNPQGVYRRDVLKAGLAAGVTLSALPLSHPAALWGAEAGQPKRGGILRVRGFDPPHFDPHL